jgi:hypothetical protein
MPHWFTTDEAGGVPVERAALGDCDLSIMRIGDTWRWFVSLSGRDVAKGSAGSAADARRQAETVAAVRRLGE